MSNSPPPEAELSAQLTAKLVRRLAREWDELNWMLFRNRLRRPLLELTRSERTLGQWTAATRSLALSLPGLLTRPWLDTIETLKHEMAHQYVDEILGGEVRPHGPAFREVCRQRGINPAATTSPETESGADRDEDKVIKRVRKLLALAESSNQHEAELAAATAQRMMLKFNISLQAETTPASTCEYRWLGKPSGRIAAHERALAGLLMEHFFVEGIWVPVYRPLEGKTGQILEICGRRENLEMAEFVHAFLSRTIERLWTEHKKAKGIRSNKDRRTFLAGAVAGFDAKLREKGAIAQREGLVWTGDAQAKAFMSRRYPRTTSTSYADPRNRSAYADGHNAGGNIVLSRPVESSGKGRPKALGPGK